MEYEEGLTFFRHKGTVVCGFVDFSLPFCFPFFLFFFFFFFFGRVRREVVEQKRRSLSRFPRACIRSVMGTKIFKHGITPIRSFPPSFFSVLGVQHSCSRKTQNAPNFRTLSRTEKRTCTRMMLILTLFRYQGDRLWSALRFLG